MAGKFTVGDLLALIQVDRTQFDRGVDGAERKLKGSADRQSGMLKALAKGWDYVGVAAKKAMIGALVGSVALVGVQGVMQFSAALVPLLGLLVAIPALAVGAAGAIAVLKIGMSGVSDALKGDEEAFAKLAPAAQETVSVLRQLAPAWQEVKRAVQSTLFDGIADKVQELGEAWLPKLADSLGAIGLGFSRMAQEAMTAATAPTFIAQIQEALFGVGDGLDAASSGIGPLVTGLGALVAAATPLLSGLGGAFADMGEEVGAWLVQANESGQLTQILQTALDTARTFGGILVQLGGIIGAVFTAANEGGGGFLNTLKTVLTSVNQFLSAGEGHNALVALFSGAQAVVKNLMPILTGVLGQLGPGITVLLQSLAGALYELAPAAVPVGKAISDIVVAVSPLLPLVAQLAALLLTALANGLSGAAAVAGPLIALFADLGSQLLTQLLPPLLEFGQRVLPDLITLGLGFADAFRPIIPVVLQLATTFLSGLLPSLMQLGDMFRGEVLPQLLQLAQQAGPLVVQMLQQLLPYVPELTRSFIQMAMSGMQLVMALMPLMPVITWLIERMIAGTGGGLILMISMLATQFRAASLAMSYWAAMISFVIDWVKGLIAWVGSAIEWVRGFVGGINAALDGIPAKIKGAFANAGSWLWNAGLDIMRGQADGIGAGVGWVKDKLGWITNLIPSWKGPEDKDRQLLRPAGRLLMTGLVDGIQGGVPDVRGTLGDLTVALPSAVDTQPRTPAAAPTGGGFDMHELARALRDVLDGLAVKLDGQTVGRLEADRAGLLYRAG